MPASAEYTIGRYQIVQSLGKGSQGSVYLAEDPRLERKVAVKVLTEQDLSSFSEATATPLEAIIASKLSHPNIVPIYDAGESSIGPYLVFEYVRGITLREQLAREGPYEAEAAATLIAAVLAAMATAHQNDIVHLDLNPRNILIDASGAPKVMDFGLSQFAHAAADRKHQAAGTLRYMAPEHFSGLPLGKWTDVFALGSTFYELLTGQHAMQGNTLNQIRGNIASGNVDFQPLRKMPHGEAIAAFLQAALHVQIDGRPGDCVTLRESFSTLQSVIAPSTAEGHVHSTIAFLMQRMQRKNDFPAITSTLSDINRLTESNSGASVDKLCNVILRDLALTSKLLKLVNSSFYGVRAGEITSISQAVTLLGFEKVRVVANSLALFGTLKSNSQVLRDSMTRSFLSGLMARHLAKRTGVTSAEEAFIAGMCQNLGENLVIYYFAEEHDEIAAAQREHKLAPNAAARGVLGVSYSELGSTVAASWKLPDIIIATIEESSARSISTREQTIVRDAAVFANQLCRWLANEADDTTLDDLAGPYTDTLNIDLPYLHRLLAAAFEKLSTFAPILEINVAQSPFCRSVTDWLARETEQLEEPA